MMMPYIRRWLIAGLLIWVPIWVTILVIKFVLDILNSSFLLLPRPYQPDMLLGFHFPGMGIVITLLVILGTGAIAGNFIGRRFVAVSDSVVAKIPLVRTVYMGVKQVMQTLFSPGGQSFRKVFLVQYPHADVWTIAFQTGEVPHPVEEALKMKDMIGLYVPTTPNPTSGFWLMFARDKVMELNIPVDQALKLVISLGVVQPGTNGNNSVKIISKV
jgi:uncharacterized membrane protein